MITLFIIGAIIISVGVVFAVSTYIPALRRHARQSPGFHKTMIAILGFVTFVAFFLFTTYLSAWATKTFSFQYLCYSGDINCTLFQERLLIPELWMHNIVPPVFMSDTYCFTGDKDVCTAVQEAYSQNSSDYPTISRYIEHVFLCFIFAIFCSLMVRGITQDDRKRKIAETCPLRR